MTDQNNNATGLPLRGMAMILIAVAVLLAGWGVYAMTREDASDVTINTNSTLQPPQPGAPAQQPASDGEQPAEGEQQAQQETSPADAQPAAPSGDAAPAPAPAPGNAAAAPTTVHVLNNSMVQGLANDVADQLKGRGYELGEVGNYAEGVVPQNTVYFTPGNAGAEQAARELADSVGGVAVARVDNLPEETRDTNSIVLVLAGETQVN